MESSVANVQHAPRRINLRTFAAGGGATTALIAGAVIAFLSVAAFVAFDGLPFGGGDSNGATVEIATGGPEAAATASAAAPAAVAASPAAISPAAASEIAAAAPPVAGPGTGGNGNNPGGGGGGTNPTDPGTPGNPVAPPPAGSAGTLGGAVDGLENTAGSLGLDVPLGDLTKSVTQPVDKALNDTLNNVGGALGNPNLGNQVSGTLNGVTNSLLGKGGVVPNLLGGKK